MIRCNLTKHTSWFGCYFVLTLLSRVIVELSIGKLKFPHANKYMYVSYDII